MYLTASILSPAKGLVRRSYATWKPRCKSGETSAQNLDIDSEIGQVTRGQVCNLHNDLQVDYGKYMHGTWSMLCIVGAMYCISEENMHAINQNNGVMSEGKGKPQCAIGL